MMAYFIGTLEECEALNGAISKTMGYPKRGVHVGGGVHVDMPDVYYPGAIGWTYKHSDVVQTGDEYAVDAVFESLSDLKGLSDEEAITIGKLATKFDAKVESIAVDVGAVDVMIKEGVEK